MSWASENQDHPVVRRLLEIGCDLDEIPDGVQYISTDPPPQAAIDYYRAKLAATDADRSET